VSVATSTIRFAIIVALVAVGAVLIAQFPQPSTGSASAGGPSATPSSSPSPNGGGQNGTGNGGGTQQPTEPLQGVKVAVYNGAGLTGLAADVAAALVKKFGVKVNSAWILNAPDTVAATTIYYVTAADKAAASDLADSYFKKLPAPPPVQKLPDTTTVPAGVQVAVYLGTDYGNSG
jgi:hypothetical protein